MPHHLQLILWNPHAEKVLVVDRPLDEIEGTRDNDEPLWQNTRHRQQTRLGGNAEKRL